MTFEEIALWAAAPIVGVAGILARHESRINGVEKIADDRDEKNEKWKERLEAKIDALGGRREWPPDSNVRT